MIQPNTLKVIVSEDVHSPYNFLESLVPVDDILDV